VNSTPEVFDYRFGAAADVEFSVDVVEVETHRGDSNAQFVRDFLVAGAFGQQVQGLFLPGTEIEILAVIARKLVSR
jgi:hypothetical protein